MALLQIDGARLLAQIQAFGKIGALEGGGVCRLALTDADREGRDFVVAAMRGLGMQVHVDTIGNVIGMYAGQTEEAPVMIGSHIDTVATGGLYDGNYGVLSGLEVVAALKNAGLRLRRPIAVAFFTNEEGARFAPDMMGSHVYCGGMTAEEAHAQRGIDGSTVGEELARIGYLGKMQPGAIIPWRYIELHIEQGPVLELTQTQIGVVQGVQGIHWLKFTIHGTTNHAGTTPMNMRHDAGYAASRIAVFVREAALRHGESQRATVGRMELTPGLVNVIAGKAQMMVDMRNTDGAVLRQMQDDVLRFAQQAASEEGCTLEYEKPVQFMPVDFDAGVVELVQAQAQGLGLTTRKMPSGAGHDAQMLAHICPSGMIFVPSIRGLSHNVKERTKDEDLINGAQVLLGVVRHLAEMS